ncbi:MAG: hypothetical protein ACR2PL_12110, partial [Dehalococcoidia bacterium]
APPPPPAQIARPAADHSCLRDAPASVNEQWSAAQTEQVERLDRLLGEMGQARSGTVSDDDAARGTRRRTGRAC